MRVRKHLTYANVMATIAVFGVVAGGGAYAASKIDTPDIANKAVTAKKLGPHAVTGGKISGGAISTPSVSLETAGVALAGVSIDSSGQIDAWFNRLGDGPPDIGHHDPGVYLLDFPGLDKLGGFPSTPYVGTATVTGQSGGVFGQPGYATARMAGFCSGMCDNPPLVNTFGPDGNRKDLGFTYVMYRSQEPADGGPIPP